MQRRILFRHLSFIFSRLFSSSNDINFCSIPSPERMEGNRSSAPLAVPSFPEPGEKWPGTRQVVVPHTCLHICGGGEEQMSRAANSGSPAGMWGL